MVNLKGVHPDDAFSTVPYEKGQTFLRYLESIVGGPEKFEPLLRNYFKNFEYKSIDTNDFRKYFEEYFKSVEDIKNIDWNTWLYSPGMPPVIPDYDKTLSESADKLVEKFIQWNGDGSIPLTIKDKENLSSNQIIYFLQKILNSEQQSVVKLQALNDLFQFDNVKNAEIKFRWLRICMKANWEDKVDAVLSWINVVGRMKYVRPLYRDLYKWETTRDKTLINFKKNRENMMHVSAYVLEKDLHLQE